ncbi:collagen alpha-2(I) chain-like [Cebus imitator]|uniref:collagen alpha-2(I) chain-like n=1 Tax=Cebus imitator TaxID=2715852 RepID=UPI0018989D6D|nr:collagen alpha-2(I) chain-like [Cebus imitator]
MGEKEGEAKPGDGGESAGALVAHSPDGRRSAHARRWGGRVTGEGAREGGRGESAIQGETGAAGARRRRGPKPREGQERAQPRQAKPRRRGRPRGRGPGCAPRAGGIGVEWRTGCDGTELWHKASCKALERSRRER